jgi:hypothetical protein
LLSNVVSLDHWVWLSVSYSEKSCSMCSADWRACPQVHMAELSILNFVYICLRSRLCPVLRRKMTTSSSPNLLIILYWCSWFSEWPVDLFLLMVYDMLIWLLFSSFFLCQSVTPQWDGFHFKMTFRWLHSRDNHHYHLRQVWHIGGGKS